MKDFYYKQFMSKVRIPINLVEKKLSLSMSCYLNGLLCFI